MEATTRSGYSKDVSFKIEAGQVAAIVGPSGTGKTTLVSLIPRFYDPVSGHVAIDGTDIRRYRLKSVRDQISFVLQDTLLFRATIWENIAYGKPDASPEEIRRAAELANAQRIHRGNARRLRHDGRRARRHALWRSAPANCHRPGGHSRYAHPDS